MHKYLSAVLLGFCCVLCVWPENQSRWFGDFYSYFIYDQKSITYLAVTDELKEENFSGLFGANQYFQSTDDNLIQFFLDLKLRGVYGDYIDPFTARLENASVDLAVNQCYISFPVSDWIIMHLGKKIKDFGNSRYFNISNRLSPRFNTEFFLDRNVPGYWEINLLTPFNLNMTALFYFFDISAIEKINFMTSLEYQYNDFCLEAGVYFEEFSDYDCVLNASYQLDMLMFYIEGILKGQADQMVLSDPGSPDYENAFSENDDTNTFAVVAGINLGYAKQTLTVEYLYRNEGLNGSGQAVYFDYIEGLTISDKQAVLAQYYTAYAFTRHYFALSYGYFSLFGLDLNLSLSALVSMQMTDADNWARYLSSELSLSLEYTVYQNLVVQLLAGVILGGEDSEFVNTREKLWDIGLGLRASF